MPKPPTSPTPFTKDQNQQHQQRKSCVYDTEKRERKLTEAQEENTYAHELT